LSKARSPLSLEQHAVMTRIVDRMREQDCIGVRIRKRCDGRLRLRQHAGGENPKTHQRTQKVARIISHGQVEMIKF